MKIGMLLASRGAFLRPFRHYTYRWNTRSKHRVATTRGTNTDVKASGNPSIDSHQHRTSGGERGPGPRDARKQLTLKGLLRMEKQQPCVSRVLDVFVCYYVASELKESTRRFTETSVAKRRTVMGTKQARVFERQLIAGVIGVIHSKETIGQLAHCQRVMLEVLTVPSSNLSFL